MRSLRANGIIMITGLRFPIKKRELIPSGTKTGMSGSKQVSGLEKAGFHLVDTNVLLQKRIVNDDSVSNSTASRFARLDDQDEVGRIATSNFLYSRFHLDPKISNDTANTIKGNWAMNYFTGKRGDAMVVSNIGKKLSGFLQLLYHDETMVIDLIAVDRAWRRKGVAEDMINFAQNNLGSFTHINVGTQVANIPSMRFYEKLGFQIIEASYLFHYHK